MKTWFVNEQGACYSIYREGLSSIENLEFSIEVNLRKYGSLVALITKENIWLAERQEHLDDFIDQHIDWYMHEHNLVSTTLKALDVLEPFWPLDFPTGMTI